MDSMKLASRIVSHTRESPKAANSEWYVWHEMGLSHENITDQQNMSDPWLPEDFLLQSQ